MGKKKVVKGVCGVVNEGGEGVEKGFLGKGHGKGGLGGGEGGDLQISGRR